MQVTDEMLEPIYPRARQVVERKCGEFNFDVKEDKERLFSSVKYALAKYEEEGFNFLALPNKEAFLTALMAQTWFDLCRT